MSFYFFVIFSKGLILESCTYLYSFDGMPPSSYLLGILALHSQLAQLVVLSPLHQARNHRWLSHVWTQCSHGRYLCSNSLLRYFQYLRHNPLLFQTKQKVLLFDETHYVMKSFILTFFPLRVIFLPQQHHFTNSRF